MAAPEWSRNRPRWVPASFQRAGGRLNEVRARAWKTRRRRYGPRGHAGTYARSRTEHGEILAGRAERRLARLVALCLADGSLLTEGQVAKTLGLDRISVRRLSDDGRISIASEPIPGEWGKHATGKVVGS